MIYIYCFQKSVVHVIQTFDMSSSITMASINYSNKLQKLYKKQTKKIKFDILDADIETFIKLRSRYQIISRKFKCNNKKIKEGNANYYKWYWTNKCLENFKKEIKECLVKVSIFSIYFELSQKFLLQYSNYCMYSYCFYELLQIFCNNFLFLY